MSEHWHFSTLLHSSCATKGEVFKILFECFETKPLLLWEPEDRSKFAANTRSRSLLGFAGIIFGVTTYWAIVTFLLKMVPNCLSPWFQSPGYVYLFFNVKGNLEGAHQCFSCKVCTHRCDALNSNLPTCTFIAMNAISHIHGRVFRLLEK